MMTKNDCYKANKRRIPTGIQVHSVGCKGTTRERWRSWNVSGLKKCANAIVDLNGIMQTLDWDVRPWLSGSGSKGNANNTCVGFEICEPSTSRDTPEAAAYLYGCVLYLCTELCRDFSIHPLNIKCHSELHREGYASNHADVNHWWGKAGTSWEPYTMTRLRHDVADALGIDLMEGVDPTMITLKKGMSGEAVRVMQDTLNALGYDCVADGIFGNKTAAVLKEFQKDNYLTADGICGPKTWAVLAPNGSDSLPDDETEEQEPTPVSPEPETDAITMSLAQALEIRSSLRRAQDILEKLIESR